MRYIVELDFRNAFHFGAADAGVGVENVSDYLHSDTIFSALLNALASLSCDSENKKLLDEIIRKYSEGEPPFLISSFGFFDLMNKRYFLPKPILTPYEFEDVQIKQLYSKEFKNVRFISLEVFENWRKKEPGVVAQACEENLDIGIIETRIQHQTDKITMASQIYRTGLAFYHTTIHPFFLLDLDESIVSLSQFQLLLKIIEINGLGGRRSTGAGAFKSEILPIDSKKDNPKISEDKRQKWKNILDLSKNGPYYLFSLYYPEEMDKLAPVGYNFELRKGWIFSTSSNKQMKRKTCRMFSEGSMFKNLPAGTLVDVTPPGFTDHSVYRYGYAWAIPFGNVVESEVKYV